MRTAISCVVNFYNAGSMVTRLSEFLPISRLLSLGEGLKFTEVVQNFGLLFSTVAEMYV
jgi:hypothetical protein